MNIQAVLKLLAQEKLCAVNPSVYDKILQWRDWWRGYYAPFHTFKETDATGRIHTRSLYSMHMAKKICEDWAAILLNETTALCVAHSPSSIFLQGEDGKGGILQKTNFWQRANQLVEKAFYSGTGAIVLRLEGVWTDSSGTVIPRPHAQIALDFLSALEIIPLRTVNGNITEAAFCSCIYHYGKKLIFLQTHLLEDDGYVIENRCFEEQNGHLHAVPLPTGAMKQLRTHSTIPLFAIIKPNRVNTFFEDTGLGEAIFADAIDNLKGVDLAFNNFCRDFLLGGKKVFYHRSLLEEHNGVLLAPDDLCRQLFVSVGDRMPDQAPMIYEHNPQLRVEENAQGMQAQLDYLSFKCGLGAKYYRFDSPNVVTATQYAGDRQELVRNAQKHSLILENALCATARMILWAGKSVLGATTDPTCQISALFDDSIIIDRETRRQLDREDVLAGLMQKFEYRMKWYGENEQKARNLVPDVQDA